MNRPGFKITWTARPFPCSSGSYFNPPSMTATEDDCLLCCDLCMPGKYSMQINLTSATTCTECLPGFYAAQEGSSQCVACEPGRYTILSDTQLRVTCHVPPAGQYVVQVRNTTLELLMGTTGTCHDRISDPSASNQILCSAQECIEQCTLQCPPLSLIHI